MSERGWHLHGRGSLGADNASQESQSGVQQLQTKCLELQAHLDVAQAEKAVLQKRLNIATMAARGAGMLQLGAAVHTACGVAPKEGSRAMLNLRSYQMSMAAAEASYAKVCTLFCFLHRIAATSNVQKGCFLQGPLTLCW